LAFAQGSTPFFVENTKIPAAPYEVEITAKGRRLFVVASRGAPMSRLRPSSESGVYSGQQGWQPFRCNPLHSVAEIVSLALSSGPVFNPEASCVAPAVPTAFQSLFAWHRSIPRYSAAWCSATHARRAAAHRVASNQRQRFSLPGWSQKSADRCASWLP
jgi:hypothetical protein